MNTNTASITIGEVSSSTIASISAITPPALRRHPHIVNYADVAADFDDLIDKAITAISTGEAVADEILGHYVQVASLVRAVSFREGKLLEQAMLRLSQVNPDLVVLTQSLKLPLVKAAIEAVSGNDWSVLESIRLDCDAASKGTYTPDLVVINKTRHAAVILDLKRSLASYGDTTRMEELKLKMMATAMILPDWLYRTQKRLMVDTVGVAIVDGASRPSDHSAGIWALNEIDDLLEIDGAAACMAHLRARFGRRVQQLLEAAARRALDLSQPPVIADSATGSRVHLLSTNGTTTHDRSDADLDGEMDPHQDSDALPASRIRIGFARRMLGA
ncbi:hypothetical protein [Pararhizobium sp. O133]|uniref:hypothetical protein n=1 Tax=Pararhizobium sp. O133 TaxID=3449278 RepID=UPI003F68940D